MCFLSIYIPTVWHGDFLGSMTHYLISCFYKCLCARLVKKMYYAGPPLIDFITPNTTVFEGSKVQLLCAATNDNDAIHELQVIWYKTSDEIKTPLKEKSRCHTCSNRTLNKQLWLDPVSHYDAGEYTCRAFNHRGSYRENSMFLTVECKFIHLCLFQNCHAVKKGAASPKSQG